MCTSIFSSLAFLLASSVFCFSGDDLMDEANLLNKDCVIEFKKKRKDRDDEMPVGPLKKANTDSSYEVVEGRHFNSISHSDTFVENALMDDEDTKFSYISPNTVAISPANINAFEQKESAQADLLPKRTTDIMDVIPSTVTRKVQIVSVQEKHDHTTFSAVQADDEDEADLMELMKKFSIGLEESRNEQTSNSESYFDFESDLED